MSATAGALVPILPPKVEPKKTGSSVYLTDSMWDRLTEISDETKQEDPSGKGYTRNEVIVHFLEWAIREYEAERKAKKKRD